MTGSYKPSNLLSTVADQHPNKTGTVIEQDNCLYLERNNNGEISYDSVPLYEDIDHSLRLIAQSTEHWTACKNQSLIHDDAVSLPVPNPLQHRRLTMI